MARIYDRKNYDKENSFDSSLLHEKRSQFNQTTNGELRRKIDQNLALIERDEPNIVESYEDAFKQSDNYLLNKR